MPNFEELWHQLKRQANDKADLPFCRAWLADLMESMEKEQEKEESENAAKVGNNQDGSC